MRMLFAELTWISLRIGFFLMLMILLLPVSAENISTSVPVINSTSSEYLLVVNNQVHSSIDSLNASAEDVMEFRIIDNNTKIFVTDGRIILDKESKPLEIESDSISEKVKDILAGLWAKLFGGKTTSGNNTEYYAKYPLNETTDNYSLNAIGEYTGSSGDAVQTVNTLTIHVKTKYITQTAGNFAIKYHKDRHASYANKLKENVETFLNYSNDLKRKIDLLEKTNKTELEHLPVSSVMISKKDLDASIEDFRVVIKNDLIKETLLSQLNLIETNTTKAINDMSNILHAKKETLLEKELNEAHNNENTIKGKLKNIKSKLRTEIFIPAGALIILGVIIGYFNVNRWKKESEYFGLYTSKAKITSPITIATILTIVILIMSITIIYVYNGDIDMLRFLI